MDCLFCKVVDGTIPAKIVKKSELFTAFNDITPQAPTHILIIPNKHFTNMAEVANSDPALAGEIFRAAGQIASENGLDSYRMNVNTGAAAEVFKQYGVNLTEEQYNTTTGLRTKEFVQWWFNYIKCY